MDNNYYYDLKIDVSKVLKHWWKFPEVTNKTNQVWRFNPEDVLNPEWINYTQNLLGFGWGAVMIFWKKENWSPIQAHVDMYDAGGIAEYGLNLVFGGKDSEMVWYYPPEEIIESPLTSAGTRHCLIPIKDLKEITRYEVGNNGKFTLVRTGVPHEIYVKDQERWCISIRAALPRTIKWNDMVEMLRSKNVLIEENNK
jgi:hypothetical protein